MLIKYLSKKKLNIVNLYDIHCIYYTIHLFIGMLIIYILSLHILCII